MAVSNDLSLDDRIKNLQNEDALTQARKSADQQFSSMTEEQYKYLRRRCKQDLFFLTGLLGYNKLSVNLHGNLCRWMMRNRSSSRFKLVLLPRSHYKTTIETADIIRIVLPDDDCNSPYPDNLGTNCRVLIGHEILEQAAEMLYGISSQFLSNPWLLFLFPECIPSLREQRVNKYQLELPRTERWNEPTIGTIGVGGRSQGKHYNKLKLDDLIGAAARDSKTEMDNAKMWIDNIQSFFVSFTQDGFDLTGTRWAMDDIYAHVMKMYGKDLLRYIRPAEEFDPVDKKIKPIFPVEYNEDKTVKCGFSTESFEIIKRNPIIWNSQYANNPSAYGREFRPEWKRWFEWKPNFYNRKLVVWNGDPENGGTKEEHDVKELDRCILIDPAMTGQAGIVVTGGNGPKIFTLETRKDTWAPGALVDYIFQLVQKWNPRLVSIEEVLFSGIYRPWLLREMQIRRYYFSVVPYKTNNKQKDVRVRGLTPFFQGGAIYFHPTQTDIDSEYDNFGGNDPYHLLDALAQGPGLWTKPLSLAEQTKRNEFESNRQVAIDTETGY